jgi:hypothetical protein
VRRGGLTVEGERRALPPGSAEALVKSLETVVATGRSLWPNGGRGLDALVIEGGTHILAEHLRQAFPHAIVLRQPLIAGAHDFHAMAAATSRAMQAVGCRVISLSLPPRAPRTLTPLLSVGGWTLRQD